MGPAPTKAHKIAPYRNRGDSNAQQQASKVPHHSLSHRAPSTSVTTQGISSKASSAASPDGPTIKARTPVLGVLP